MLARGNSVEEKYETPTHGPSPLEVFFQVCSDHLKPTNPQVCLMDDSCYILNFDAGKKNKIHHHS
jgi:hypothetical protein